MNPGVGRLQTTSVAAVAVAAALGAARADAAAWEFHPSVEAGYLYDDNYRLTPPGTEIQVDGGMVDAQLEMRSVTQQSEFSFTPRARVTYFPNHSDLESHDYYGTLNWLHHGQRVEAGVLAQYSQQDVINSEQPDAGIGGGVLGVPDFGDSGRIIVHNTRDRGDLRPSVSFDLSPRHTLELDAGYTDVSFDREINDAQVDFTAEDLAAGFIWRSSETSSLTLRGRGARYDIDTRGAFNAYGAELQWDTRSAAGTRTYLRGGAQSVDTVSGGSETAWVAGGGVSMVMGRNQLFLDLSRGVGPSSAGAVVARDQLRLQFTRDFTPRLSLITGIRGTHDDDTDRNSTFAERSYATGDLGLQWRWTEDLALHFAYDYTWQKFHGSSVDATASGFLVSLLYQPLQSRR